ncbi:hypothetical protein [Caloramator sp. E03]|nr:hypothetical protein [Caloramator sp. E03]
MQEYRKIPVFTYMFKDKAVADLCLIITSSSSCFLCLDRWYYA